MEKTTPMNNALNIHTAIFAILLLGSVGPAIAETDIPHPTYTWSLTPTSGDWDTPANWNPEGVPDYDERAVFGVSSVTNITAPISKILRSVQFEPGASQYTINASASISWREEGVFNESGITQIFNGTSFGFGHGATAGDLVIYNVTSYVSFGTGADAGSGTFNIDVNGSASFSGTGRLGSGSAGSATFNNGGRIFFGHRSTADEATFINYGGTAFGEPGAEIDFTRAGAGSSTIILYGGSVFGAVGARCSFDKSSAYSATLIAYGGAGGARSGASILFTNSSGNTARVEVFGNGNIDFSRQGVADNTIGSLEGDGIVFLGDGTLAIGGNNINTTFAGTITEQGGIHEGGPGAISKTGSGTLILTGASDYTDGTTVESGLLFVNNTSGSATGSGPVSIAGGGLAGAGIITGPLTVGTGSSSGAALAPGASGSTTGTLTVQNALSLLADATYNAQLNSTTLLADDVISAGVIIMNGAKMKLTDLGATTLGAGTSFTLINNTSTAATIGTFSNLGDGATITIGSNTYQANYEGGDGNDLTLTVVP
jgi:autotransporter-associated beta strand protein